MSLIQVSRSESNVAQIYLDRPEARNALNWDLVDALDAAFDELESDPPVGLFLRARGPAFCAGLDKDEYRAILTMSAPEVAEEREAFYRKLSRLAALQFPTIAVLEGPAVTGGVGLASFCDFRLATPDAWIRVTFNELGFFPGLGMSVSLTHVAGEAFARRMLLLGERMTASEAHRVGFLDWIVERAELDDHLAQLEKQIAAADARVVAMMKTDLHGHFQRTVSGKLTSEAQLEGFTSTLPGFEERARRFIGSR